MLLLSSIMAAILLIMPGGFNLANLAFFVVFTRVELGVVLGLGLAFARSAGAYCVVLVA